MDMALPDWSTLPRDLLSCIGKRLPSLGDTLRFRAVCNSFRASIPPPKPLSPRSYLCIPLPCDSHPHSGAQFLVTHSTVYEIQPLKQTAQPWLVGIQEFNSGRVRVQNPLFENRFEISITENLPKSLNLLDYQVKEIAKVHHLELVSPQEGKPQHDFFTKVVGSTCHNETDAEFALLALHDVRTLLVWRNIDNKWTFLNINYGIITDMIYHNKKFYVAFSTGFTVTVDPKSLTIAEVAAPVQEKALVPVLYLLQSLQDLFMIGTYRGFSTLRGKGPAQLNEFYVCKLDEERRQWVWVKDELENRMLFLNEDHSFSVSAEGFSGCEGNSLFYTYFDVSFLTDNRPSVGIFHFKDGYGVPNYSHTFLPPPDWLK